MDIDTTTSVTTSTSATSFTASAARFPSSAQPPGIGIRFPQTGVLAPTPSGYFAITDGAPQFARRAGDSSHSQLCAAVRDGNATAVKRMLAAGDGNLNTIDPDSRMTVLALAAQHGHRDVVRLLCEGASADDIHRDDLGLSALKTAAFHGQTDVVELLLSKSTTQQRKDEALHGSTFLEQVATMELLVAHGTRVDQPLTQGNTPLHQAAFGLGAAVRTSMSGSAAPGTVSLDKFVARLAPTTLLQAVERNDANALTRLLTELRQPGKNLAQVISQVGELDNRNDSWLQDKRLTPLMAAAYLGYEPLLKLLLMFGADVDQVDFFDRTALIWAARSGHAEVVQALVEAGAKLEHFHVSGETALSTAAAHGRTATVKALLQSGARADPTTHNGLTPLMSASQNGVTAIVEALLEYGADVHKVLNGRTALAFARLHGHTDTVQVLLSAGAGEQLRMMQD